jgi:hypothetical protein
MGLLLVGQKSEGVFVPRARQMGRSENASTPTLQKIKLIRGLSLKHMFYKQIFAKHRA